MSRRRIDAPSNPLIEHVLRIAGVDSIRAVAIDTGLVPSTLDRQLKGEQPLRVDGLNTICRKYGAPFLPAYVAAGWITKAERRREVKGLTNATDQELTEEMMRRMHASPHGHELLTRPLNGEDTP